MSMMRRTLLVLPLAALAALGCADSTGPTAVSPSTLYFISSTAYPNSHTTLYRTALDGGPSVPLVVDTLPNGAWLQGWFQPWVARGGKEIRVLVWKSGEGDLLASLDPSGALLSSAPYPAGTPYYYPQAQLSPDGTRLAWIEPYAQVPSIRIVDLEGNLVQAVRLDTLTGASGDVAWSSDGRSIAYVAWRYTQLSPYTPTDVRLFTRRLSDGFTMPVAALAGIGRAPAWSRDGRWLTVSVGGDIHRVRSDGNGLVQVLYSGELAQAGTSAWGPGDSLVAVSAGSGIVLLRPDGAHPRVFDAGGSLESLVWGE